MPGQNFIDLFEGARRKRGANKRRMNVANAINAARPMPMNMPTQQPFNTGPGANGIVEPSKPVMLDRQTNPPSVYHEGETVVPFRGGKQIIPARTEGQQQRLASLQQAKGYPGYQTGGTVLNASS